MQLIRLHRFVPIQFHQVISDLLFADGGRDVVTEPSPGGSATWERQEVRWPVESEARSCMGSGLHRLCISRMTYREIIKQTGLLIHLQTINTLGLFNLYLHYGFKDPSVAWNITKAADACLSFNLVLEKYHQEQFGKLELQTVDI